MWSVNLVKECHYIPQELCIGVIPICGRKGEDLNHSLGELALNGYIYGEVCGMPWSAGQPLLIFLYQPYTVRQPTLW